MFLFTQNILDYFSLILPNHPKKVLLFLWKTSSTKIVFRGLITSNRVRRLFTIFTFILLWFRVLNISLIVLFRPLSISLDFVVQESKTFHKLIKVNGLAKFKFEIIFASFILLLIFWIIFFKKTMLIKWQVSFIVSIFIFMSHSFISVNQFFSTLRQGKLMIGILLVSIFYIILNIVSGNHSLLRIRSWFSSDYFLFFSFTFNNVICMRLNSGAVIFR